MRLLLPVCASLLLACGSNGSGGGDGTPADAPTLTGDKYSLSWGPVNVPAGTENTQCIWLRLSNDTEIKVHSMHNVLSVGSHHLIVYKDDKDTVEQTTPTPCQPFTGALNTTGMIAPIAITQRADDPIYLPSGVAYTFAPHQMVKLEMHYKNTGDEAVDVTANVDFFAADPATIQDEAAIMFTGSPDISLMPGETKTLHQFFTVPPNTDFSAAKFFAITGHTHRLGTDVKVRVGTKGGTLSEVYAPTPFDWAEPATATPPEFSVPAGGGFDFECTWHNTTTSTVKFGESADAEMCFFWAYYYPSIGSKVCFHTDQYGGAAGLNVCCPGDSLCTYLEQML